MIKTVSRDYLAIFQYFMTDLFRFLEFDGPIFCLQMPWVHTTDPTPEISDALLWNHIFVQQHVPVIVHDGYASKCIIRAIDTYHFTIKRDNWCFTTKKVRFGAKNRIANRTRTCQYLLLTAFLFLLMCYYCDSSDLFLGIFFKSLFVPFLFQIF